MILTAGMVVHDTIMDKDAFHRGVFFFDNLDHVTGCEHDGYYFTKSGFLSFHDIE